MVTTLKYLSFIIISFLFIQCASMPTKEEVLNNFNTSSANILSTKYTGEYTYKPYGKKDTLNLKATCWVEKYPENKVLGMKVKMLHDGGFIRYYDGKNYYTIDNKELKTKVENPMVSNIMPFEGSVWDNLIFRELIDGVPIEKLKEFNITYNLEDNLHEDSSYILKFVLPDSGEFTGFTKLWIDKKTFLPRKMISEYYFNGNTQYSKIVISNLTVNTPLISQVFSEFEIPENFLVEYYSPPKKGETQLLPNGVLASGFEFSTLEGRKISLKDLKGKMVLLDFWYMSCYPCVKAMPHLEKLYNEYSLKGLVVLGVNPVDTNSIDELNEFLVKNEISYPVVLGGSTIVNSYRVKSYPTLYLIDKGGKIVYSTVGFDSSTVEVLDSLISEGLSK